MTITWPSPGGTVRCRCQPVPLAVATPRPSLWLDDARVIDGYWTTRCTECDGTGRWSISTLRGLRRMRDKWWRWPISAVIALRRHPCVPCRGTGRTIECLAAP